jgi:hypothetical protein
MIKFTEGTYLLSIIRKSLMNWDTEISIDQEGKNPRQFHKVK